MTRRAQVGEVIISRFGIYGNLKNRVASRQQDLAHQMWPLASPNSKKFSKNSVYYSYLHWEVWGTHNAFWKLVSLTRNLIFEKSQQAKKSQFPVEFNQENSSGDLCQSRNEFPEIILRNIECWGSPRGHFVSGSERFLILLNTLDAHPKVRKILGCPK